jgi:hypothetical protein
MHDSIMFPHRNIRKYTCTSRGGKTDYQIVHILIDRRRNKELFNDAVSCWDCVASLIGERINE